MPEYKTEDERREEIKNLLKKLAELDITLKVDGMKEFLNKSNEFVKEGRYFEGRINLPGLNRVMLCFFPLVKGKVCDVTLRHVK
jgi:hypothetical protein